MVLSQTLDALDRWVSRAGHLRFHTERLDAANVSNSSDWTGRRVSSDPISVAELTMDNASGRPANPSRGGRFSVFVGMDLLDVRL